MPNQKPGALAGIKIIDMTSVVFGPLATQMLGDLGADVIKVESPEGDMLRQVQPAQHPSMGAAFLGTNRNKRSVVLDLKTPEGRKQLQMLLTDADVFVSSIRPAALARLSLSPWRRLGSARTGHMRINPPMTIRCNRFRVWRGWP